MYQSQAISLLCGNFHIDVTVSHRIHDLTQCDEFISIVKFVQVQCVIDRDSARSVIIIIHSFSKHMHQFDLMPNNPLHIPSISITFLGK